MIYKVRRGKHRAWPFRVGLFRKPHNASAFVVFHEDCRYSLDGPDMMDTNKLFGIGYFWNHHRESARFGWRYEPDSGMVILSAYCYVNGQRVIEDLTAVEILEPVELDILIMGGQYFFSVDGKELAQISFTHRKTWAYPLGLFFGGNKKSPHTMHVEIKRL